MHASGGRSLVSVGWVDTGRDRSVPSAGQVDTGRDRSVVSGWMNGWTQEETGQWCQWAGWTHGWTQEEGLSVGDWTGELTDKSGEGIDEWLADG